VKDSLVPRADQTLSALVEDLELRGLLSETLVVWTGDFGRMPRISKPWASRDHWPHAFTTVLAGAGITGGAVLGSTDRLAAEVTDAPVSPADLTATILDALGIDPGTTISAPLSKPVPITSGKSVLSLLTA
jgi:arylsulfatase A-like enzyme